MDTTLHSHLIAQHIQDRMEEATAARTARAATNDRPREPRLLALKRLLHRPVPVEAAAVSAPPRSPRAARPARAGG
jgi:hypothetical protein